MLSKCYSYKEIVKRCGDVRERGRGGGAQPLTAFELQHGHADGQEQHYPRDGGHEAQVHVRLQQVPATSQYAPQRSRGHGQRQTVAHVPQQHRHSLHRPDDTCERNER